MAEMERMTQEPGPGPGQGPDENQPVLEALQTIKTFIAAQKQKGNQGADQMAQSLIGLINAIGSTAQTPETEAGKPQPASMGQLPENSAPGARQASPVL